jgi:hypothetical protein
MPERIQRRRTKGWRMPTDAVYVGRGSEWGNPYRVGDHAMIYTPIGPRKPGVAHGYGPLITPRIAVLLFQVYIADRLEDVIRADLAGRDLACWCPAGRPAVPRRRAAGDREPSPHAGAPA